MTQSPDLTPPQDQDAEAAMAEREATHSGSAAEHTADADRSFVPKPRFPAGQPEGRASGIPGQPGYDPTDPDPEPDDSLPGQGQ